MVSIADGSVCIQTCGESQFAPPSWLGEVALMASHLRKHNLLNKISEHVRFARRRGARYDVIDDLSVRICYAVSSERTLETFYATVQPFAVPFMALLGRASLPAPSTLSRFFATLPASPLEALRTLFLEDLLARPLSTEEHAAGLWDRQGNRWHVFDIDGTREAARQRALPKSPDRPAPQLRLRPRCAPGYTGGKRGEIVRTRTTVLQMHTHQWIASFGTPFNGQYREELPRAKAAIQTYIQAHDFPAERTLLRLDGQYGNGAVVADVSDFAYVTRGKDYGLLDRADIQARLHLPAGHLSSAESGVCRALYDCPDQRLCENGPLVRVIVATHPAPTKKKKKRQVGLTRDGIVYMNTAEKPMGACAWSMGPAFAVAVRVHCESLANGVEAPQPNRVRSASCFIPWWWDRLRSSGETGIGGISDGHVCTYIANAWISRWSLFVPPLRPSPLRRSLGHSGHITAYRGMIG